jgi:hypothetical protein
VTIDRKQCVACTAVKPLHWFEEGEGVCSVCWEEIEGGRDLTRAQGHETKECVRCKNDLPLPEFGSDRAARDGKRACCFTCRQRDTELARVKRNYAAYVSKIKARHGQNGVRGRESHQQEQKSQ